MVKVAHEYLDIVATLKTPTSHGAIKGHMFKITRPALCIHTDLRPVLGGARAYDGEPGEDRVRDYRAFLHELAKRLEHDESLTQYYTRPDDLPNYYVVPPHLQDTLDRTTRPDYIPHWYIQPYFRPPLNPPKSASGSDAKEEEAPAAKRVKIDSST